MTALDHNLISSNNPCKTGGIHTWTLRVLLWQDESGVNGDEEKRSICLQTMASSVSIGNVRANSVAREL
ncbi:MAG: hypothetical protein GY746_04195 [Gammaproteobacteria bacterium]|nr:hypothetical protein [Gammaproteobacteria bacterium]